MTDKLQQEDTVSADRKKRVIYDPEAWRKSDKSGRVTSAVTSRQNFNSEKFGNRNDDEEELDDEDLKEGAAVGTSQPDVPPNARDNEDETPEMAKNGRPTKPTDSPQIQMVTGNQAEVDDRTGAMAKNPVSSASMPGYHKEEVNMSAKLIAEGLVKKALTRISTDRNKGIDEVPFDGPYKERQDTVTDKSGAKHTAMSRVRHLARMARDKQQNEAVRSPYTGAKVTGPKDLEAEKEHYQKVRAAERDNELEKVKNK